MDLTSVVSENVNVFFFWSKNVQGTSSRHCQSGGIRAHETPDIGHFPRISRFFFIHRYTNRSGAFSNLFHYIFPMNIQKDCLVFFLCPISISGIMNVKKNSKLEREDKTNGNPLLHHGIYFFFHENFPINIQNDSLVFWLLPCLYF